MPKKVINRREFLKKTTGIAAGVVAFPYIVRSSALGKSGSVAPSNRITLGCIGTGEQGRYVMSNFLQMPDVEIVAVCDVRKSARDEATAMIHKQCGKKDIAEYNDFRKLCTDKSIDTVLIATPDHWHVLQALEAARNGKDMYMEKPFGMSVEQSQVLRREIKRLGRVFQLGTQQRSDRNFRFACELVLNGRLGKVHTIKVGAHPSIKSPNFPVVPVPEGTDYEMWLGPAPWAPYMHERVEAVELWTKYWWHVSDYTLGWISGWGIHHLDIMQWGNGSEISGPVEVEGTAEFPDDGLCDCATSWDVKLKYSNGTQVLFKDSNQNKQGVVFEGEDGWVFVNRGVLEAEPKSLLNEKIGPNEINLPVSTHHQQNFIDCVKSRGKPVSPIESAARSDITCQLSDIATRTGRKLKWDPQAEKFIGDELANGMLKRAMRSPWHL